MPPAAATSDETRRAPSLAAGTRTLQWSLELPHVGVEHAGVYQCVASNRFGHATCTRRLIVLPAPTVATTASTSAITTYSHTSPPLVVPAAAAARRGTLCPSTTLAAAPHPQSFSMCAYVI